MDDSELTKEEYEEKKRRSIEIQKKKRFSNIFVLCASLFLIVETLIILCALMIPLFAIFSHIIPHFEDNATMIGMVFAVAQMVFFVGGLFLGFLIFRNVVNLVIRKNHWEDRLTDDVKSHYLKKTKEEKEMELKR